jgi:hypothetical protein
MSSAIHSLRKHPVASLGFSAAGLVFSAAVLVEFQADRQEKRSIVDPTVHARRLPRSYNAQAVSDYWAVRPVSVSCRFGHLVYELAPLAAKFLRDFVITSPNDEEIAKNLQTVHAANLREALTNLGPAWVKVGQQLSIRPDLMSPTVLAELKLLCDSVRPIPDEIALELMRSELGGDDLSQKFEDLHLVASASLGQVYKAKLRENGKHVAIKVQRPGMLSSFSLDLFLLQKYGALVDAFTSVFTNQPPFHKKLLESFSRGSYSVCVVVDLFEKESHDLLL